jgi:AcrR family transcriptional regulator
MEIRPTVRDDQLDNAGHDEEAERGKPCGETQHKQNRERDFGDADQYAAFGSKERLFFEAVDLYVELVGYRPVQALESAATAREGIEAMLREAVDIYCDPNTPSGCLLFLGAINCAPANKSVQDHMRTYRVQAPDLIRKRLERGVTEGDVPKGIDLEPLVSLFACFVHGLPVRARDGASRDELLAGVSAAMAAWIG